MRGRYRQATHSPLVIANRGAVKQSTGMELDGVPPPWIATPFGLAMTDERAVQASRSLPLVIANRGAVKQSTNTKLDGVPPPWIAMPFGLAMTGGPSLPRHCEPQSGEAIHKRGVTDGHLLRAFPR